MTEPKREKLFMQIAIDMATDQITATEARQKSQDVVLGPFVETVAGKYRVLLEVSTVNQAYQELITYLKQHSNTDKRRWAAVSVLVYALLAQRDVDLVKKRTLEAFVNSEGAILPDVEMIACNIIDAVVADPEIANDHTYCAVLLRFRPGLQNPTI
jgi:hypothetical protein